MPPEKGAESPPMSFSKADDLAIEKFNVKLQETLEREQRLLRHDEWRGNKLPPFSIEPFPRERDRLQGKGMTHEDRLMRKQWLTDQELSPNEPRYIAELQPRNPFRRVFGAPWNALFNALRPMLGNDLVIKGRYFVPRYVMGAVAMYAIYYHMKYNPNTWEDKHGWNIYGSKPVLLAEGEEYPTMSDTDFHDKGFKHRTALLYTRNVEQPKCR